MEPTKGFREVLKSQLEFMWRCLIPDEPHNECCIGVGSPPEIIDGVDYPEIPPAVGVCDCGATTRNNLRQALREKITKQGDK